MHLNQRLPAILSIAVFVAMCGRVEAQQFGYSAFQQNEDSSVSSAGPMTLQQFQELALEHNPTLEQARAITWKAYGRYEQAGLYPNPVIGYMAAEIGNGGEAGQQGAFIQQEFLTGEKRDLSRSVAARHRLRTEHLLTSQQYRVTNAVRKEYYSILAAEKMRLLAKDLLNMARQGHKTTTTRIEQGEGTKNDVLLAHIEVSQAEIKMFEAENSFQTSWRRMIALVGVPDLLPTKISGDIGESVPELTWKEAWLNLIELSPQLKMAEANQERAKSSWARARAEVVPNITVQGSTQYDFGTRTQVAGLQIGVPWPIFNRNQGNIRTAEAELVRTAHEVDRVELMLWRNLANAFKQYAIAQMKADKYRRSILPDARESLRYSRALLMEGEIPYLQQLTTQRIYTQTNWEYIETLLQLRLRMIDIDGLLLNDGLAAPEISFD